MRRQRQREDHRKCGSGHGLLLLGNHKKDAGSGFEQNCSFEHKEEKKKKKEICTRQKYKNTINVCKSK